MDRRTFLKRAVQIGGIGALSTMGWRESFGVGIGRVWDTPSSETPTYAPNSSWSTWDEIIEAGWGDSGNVFIALMEGGLSGNESGQGAGLSGSNLVLTQIGSVAAASGSPLSRHLDIGDGFTWKETGIETIVNGGGSWCLIWKFHTWALPSADNAVFVRFRDGTPNDAFDIGDYQNGRLHFYVLSNGSVILSKITSSGHETSGVVYVVMEYDASTTTFKGGFVDSGSPSGAVKPTSWSTHFNTSDMVSNVGAINWSNLNDQLYILGGSDFLFHGSCYYIVAAKKTLLTA